MPYLLDYTICINLQSFKFLLTFFVYSVSALFRQIYRGIQCLIDALVIFSVQGNFLSIDLLVQFVYFHEP